MARTARKTAQVIQDDFDRAFFRRNDAFQAFLNFGNVGFDALVIRRNFTIA